MVAKSEVIHITLTIIVSAAVTLAVEYWPARHASQVAPATAAPFTPAPGMPAMARNPPHPAERILAPAANTVARVVDGEPNAAVAAEAESSPEEGQPAEPLPVAFHIRNRRDLHLIDGLITNISSKPLAITLRATNSSTQATSEISFQLAPGERKTYSSDDLYMQSNDQLIVQSPPYQDRVVQVP
jgi:hypothetical protein